MQRQRTIVSTVALLVGICAGAPAAALAGAPLLSGYGGPGAGAQTIVGAALVNGGGSSGGGSSAGGSATGGGSANGGSAGAGSEPAGSGGAESSSTRDSSTASANPRRARGASSRGHSSQSPVAATGTHPRAAGANPTPSHLGASAAVTDNEAGMSWFSGADLLALVLAAGVLALVAVATVRLTRAEHG
jgi:hypothetical protein